MDEDYNYTRSPAWEELVITFIIRSCYILVSRMNKETQQDLFSVDVTAVCRCDVVSCLGYSFRKSI